MRTLAVSLVLVMVLAVAASAQPSGLQKKFGGKRPRPFMVLGMRGFAVSGDSYELAGLNIVGPPKPPKSEDSEEATTSTDDKRPPLRGILHIGASAYALKNVEVTLEDFEAKTPDGKTISGKRPSAFSATLCKLPDKEALADGEADEDSDEEADEDSEDSDSEDSASESSEPELEEVGTLSLTIEAKDIAMMQRPAAKGEASIDGTTWTIYGAVAAPMPRPQRDRMGDKSDDSSDDDTEDDSDTASEVEEGF